MEHHSERSGRAEISHASYGKDGIRILLRVPSDAGDLPLDITLAILVEGDFLESYESGDNRAVLPSDTLRRHALAEASRHPSTDVEVLIESIAARILLANSALRQVTVNARHRGWASRGRRTFVAMPWTCTAVVSVSRDAATVRRAGVVDLHILATTGSAFTGFMRDDLTVQADSEDRPICGTLEATWTYRDGSLDDERPAADQVTQQLIDAFVDRPSNAIQQLLTDVTKTVLAQQPAITTLSLEFTSLPIAPNPLADAESNEPPSYEIGASPAGITRVTVARGISP